MVVLLGPVALQTGLVGSVKNSGTFRVQGSGLGVQGSGVRSQESGVRVQGAGCRVQGAGFSVQDAGCRVQSEGCRAQGAGCRVQGADVVEETFVKTYSCTERKQKISVRGRVYLNSQP